MARYNSISSTSSVAGGSTISTPASGLLTTLTGTGTVTIPNPVLYTGQTQTFYNSTGSAITLSTPSGNFIAPGIASATSISIPAGSIFTAVSDGTNYLAQDWLGGSVSTTNLVATGGTIDGINIGATTQGTGKFSTLNVTSTTTLAGMTATTGAFSGISTFTNNAAATLGTTGTGALQVSGGASVAGILNVGGATYHGGTVGIGNTGGLGAQNLHVGGTAGGGSINGYTRLAVEAPDYAVTTMKSPAANFSQVIFTDPTSTNLGGINFFNSTNATPNAMAFLTGGGNERMRIDSSGNVGIGTNSNPGTPVSGRLSVLPAANPTTAAASTTLTLGETTNNSAYQLRMAYSFLSSVYTGVIDAVQNSAGAPLSINPTGGNVGIGNTSPTVSLDLSTRTDAIAVPKGTTAQRPATPVAGYHRFNSSTNFAEYYTGTQWAQYGSISPTTVAYLIVAGGGGGAGGEGGGGGAGGVLQNASQAVTPGTVYNITVGTGGTGNTNPGGNGGNSTVFGLTAVGGGGGGSVNSNNAQAGGSGGGGGRTSTIRTYGGAGTAGQGNTGGTGIENIAGYAAAGGGGASAVGGNGSGLVGGNGGAGVANQISGSVIGQLSSSTYYVGGGGGAGGGNNNGNPSSGTGGLGGGGNGGLNAGSATGGVAGTPYTGGGGGGGGQGNTGANGGSGVVVIAYPSGYKDAVATGTYARTVNAGNTIYTFTGPGSITF